MVIRDATPADLPGILAIYNEVIINTTAVYALEPVTIEDRAQWLAARQTRGFPVLVAVEGDAVHGFASYGEWRGPGPDINLRRNIRCMSGMARVAGVLDSN